MDIVESVDSNSVAWLKLGRVILQTAQSLTRAILLLVCEPLAVAVFKTRANGPGRNHLGLTRFYFDSRLPGTTKEFRSYVCLA